jgi:hypothetical protein
MKRVDLNNHFREKGSLTESLFTDFYVEVRFGAPVMK